MRDWSKHVTWPNILQLKLGDIQEYPQIFKTARVAKKIWRIIKTIASIWGENMLGYFVLGHYLFLKAHSFPWAMLSENCSLLRTDSVLAYFRAKWRLLFIYPISHIYFLVYTQGLHNYCTLCRYACMIENAVAHPINAAYNVKVGYIIQYWVYNGFCIFWLAALFSMEWHKHSEKSNQGSTFREKPWGQLIPKFSDLHVVTS